jgi:hypothetical protein
MGRMSSKVGNATIQDSPQAPNQIRKKSSEKPMAFKVQINDTMQVMSADRMNGMMTPAYLAGSLTPPRMDLEDLAECISFPPIGNHHIG